MNKHSATKILSELWRCLGVWLRTPRNPGTYNPAPHAARPSNGQCRMQQGAEPDQWRCECGFAALQDARPACIRKRPDVPPVVQGQTFEEWQETSVGEYCTTVAKLAEEKAPNLAVEDKLRLAFNSGKRAASPPKMGLADGKGKP